MLLEKPVLQDHLHKMTYSREKYTMLVGKIIGKRRNYGILYM